MELYRIALSTPGARGPVVAALLGRFPIAMVSLSLLFYAQRRTGSYAVAGLLSAAVLIGVAAGSVVQGRIIDRVGASGPLLAAAGIFTAFSGIQLTALESAAPTWFCVLCGAGMGLSQPAIGATSRTMWTRLLPPGRVLTAALTYEAIVTEVYFIVGPALSGLLLIAPWPGTGLLVGVVAMAAGSVWYASTETIRGLTPGPEPVRRRWLGALGSPGLRTVALASLGMGLILGFVEVAIPAEANRQGNPALGGVLLALWSVSSALFGLAYGNRPWPRSLRSRLPLLLAGFAVLVLPMAATRSLPVLAALLLLAGTTITPQTAAHAEAAEATAAGRLVTESFGWVVTASTVGIGLGHVLSGLVVQAHGLPAAYVAAASAGALLAAAVHLRRHTVTERESHA